MATYNLKKKIQKYGHTLPYEWTAPVSNHDGEEPVHVVMKKNYISTFM